MNALDPIAAVTARDPYPWYARLVAETPFYRDDAGEMWVASSAAAIEAVLTSPLLKVRPPSEPVPGAIAGTAAGDVFSRLVRMNDGPYHGALKPVLSSAFDRLDTAMLSAVSERAATQLLAAARSTPHADSLSEYSLALPAVVIATLIGVPPTAIAGLPQRVREVVRAFAPGARPDDVTNGSASATVLRDAVSEAFHAASTPLAMTIGCAPPDGTVAAADLAANGVGFFSQAYDATAGLIGAVLIALAEHRELCDRARADDAFFAAVVAEVARHDAPVQNTRRFAAGDGVIFGRHVRAGDMILALLAAANRDPAVNPDPNRFDPGRTNRRSYTFGFGPHACPGTTLADTVARVGVARLLDSGLDLAALRSPVGYVPSGNARIPLFRPARLSSAVATG